MLECGADERQERFDVLIVEGKHREAVEEVDCLGVTGQSMLGFERTIAGAISHNST